MNRRKGEIAVALYDLLHRCGIFLEELNVLNVGWMSNERWMEKDWMHWIRSICLNEQYVEFSTPIKHKKKNGPFESQK